MGAEKDYYAKQYGKALLSEEIDDFVTGTTGLSRNADEGLSIQFGSSSIEIYGPDSWALQVNLINAIHAVMKAESKDIRNELWESMPDSVKRKIEFENQLANQSKYPNGIVEAMKAEFERESKNG